MFEVKTNGKALDSLDERLENLLYRIVSSNWTNLRIMRKLIRRRYTKMYWLKAWFLGLSKDDKFAFREIQTVVYSGFSLYKFDKKRWSKRMTEGFIEEMFEKGVFSFVQDR